ncbi:MAG TPA: 4Fe-4S dicluster domain-containing protein [Candidatus Acetothermia bacterium]|nr:4Fe-4S dicluster domain-containing protein [Candidatus Acetothermia bacterium]
MTELVVVSGKGGTGKTTLVASLAALARDAVIADCDVDAPDLHLLLRPETTDRSPYQGSEKAGIDPNLCTRCGACASACRFGAVERAGEAFRIDSLSCEGCGACAFVCPAGAIAMQRQLSGWIQVSRCRYGVFVHGELRPGEEASGKLVTQVKMRARELARAEAARLLIVDGAPGIGCPVIASLSGAHVALIVTEPSRSALHDLKRVAAVARQFRAKPLVAINKADLAPDLADEIAAHAQSEGIPILARIPYDEEVVAALVAGRPLIEDGGGPAAEAIRLLWERLTAAIGLKTSSATGVAGEGDGNQWTR